ncbi:MAG TPA: hypothetical protein V6D29_13995 [Leptolyngbyaceae cyanobacterium]
MISVSNSRTPAIVRALQKALRVPLKLIDLASLLPAEIQFKVNQFKHANALSAVSSMDAEIVKSLKREGVFITSLEALGIPDTAAMLQAAESILPKIADQPGNTGYDIHASQDLVLERPELFAWGLHDRILNIAEASIGIPAAFNDIHIRRDFANGVQSGSRLWHVDSYDHRILRIIIYLSNVSKTGGAHEYIPRQKSRFWVTVLEHFGTIPDKVMEMLGLQKHVKSCPGPKGTVIFSMTSRVLHRGTVPQDSERYTLIYNYNSRHPKRPQEASPRVPKERLVRVAQQFPKRQQDCMLWM